MKNKTLPTLFSENIVKSTGFVAFYISEEEMHLLEDSNWSYHTNPQKAPSGLGKMYPCSEFKLWIGAKLLYTLCWVENEEQYVGPAQQNGKMEGILLILLDFNSGHYLEHSNV